MKFIFYYIHIYLILHLIKANYVTNQNYITNKKIKLKITIIIHQLLKKIIHNKNTL